MIRTCGSASSGITSGVGFAIAKTIASRFMPRQRVGVDQAGAGEADEEVGALEDVVGPALDPLRVGGLGEPALDRRHAVGA